MYKLSLEEVKAGMKLAKDVVLEDGRFLLLKGFTIKPRYIAKLKAYNVPFIYVDEGIIELEEISEERVYEDAFTNIKSIMESIRYDEKVDIVQLKETVNDMVQHILNDDMIFMTLTGIRDIDNYTFLHSVDVCIYSVVTAKALNMDHSDIYDLAMAAILHDVGKCKVPLSILNKPGKLTEEEFEVMKRHAINGLEIASQLPGLSEKIARVICQHHEKWDGSGYPLGLKSYDIELHARIISISDVYDALTANRVYRKRFMPHEAAEYLMANNESQFDPKIMKCFINSIAIYPKDIVVLLNTGEVARVLPSKGMASMRPKVSVITRKDGPPVIDPYEIDLRKNPTVFVVDIIS
ncbi:MAG: HD-GYP domain-containing protein [Acetivibrionales bacterium]|jgi:HD-GYP domain-containing protein (c-di-GMP phosphodiesterase class II)